MSERSNTTPHGQKTVAVVVPYYRADLTSDEQLSLKHLRRFLVDYDRYLILPRSLDKTPADFELKRFDNDYFKSVLDYNRLMLAPHFYETFRDYKYVLIYQLDALVFSDELMQWCERDLDYIGAPWLKNITDPQQGFSNVGNGGFSLRKVESILRVLNAKEIVTDARDYWKEYCQNHSRLKQLLNLHRKYLKRLRMFSDVSWYIKHPHDMEDVFWANIAPRIDPSFKIASVEQGLHFSFESAPRYCFEQNNQQLPFGCHAWDRNDRAFWEQYLLTDHEEHRVAASSKNAATVSM